MKASKNELKNMFVMKLNAKSFKVYKTTLQLEKPTSSRRH